MKIPSVCVVLAIMGLAGCGGSDPSEVTCGAGTTLVGEECVPDGTVICPQGTTFDSSTSACVLDPSACAEGTVLVEDQCIPEDDVRVADQEEAAEPNDLTTAGAIALPALDASLVIHGCITPVEGARDLDRWTVTATEPTALEITVDGVHGLAGGFVATDASDNPLLATWERLGINLVGDTSRRQIFLPAAGDYSLQIDDFRALLLDQPAGGPDACYFATIRHIALPTPSPLADTQTATSTGDLQSYLFTVPSDGDILDLTQVTTTSAVELAMVVMRDGELHATGDAHLTVGGLGVDEEILVVLDAVSNFGLSPTPYTLNRVLVAGQQLPVTGATITATRHNGAHPDAAWLDRNYFYFDVAASDQVVQLSVTVPMIASFQILRPNLMSSLGPDVFADLNSYNSGSAGGYLYFREPGRYYLVIDDPAGAADTTFTVTARVNQLEANATSYGPPGTIRDLNIQGQNYYRLQVDPSYEWAEFNVIVSSWGHTRATITVYDLTHEGVIGSDQVPQLQSGSVPLSGNASSEPMTRVLANGPRDYLVAVGGAIPQGTYPPRVALSISEHAHTTIGPLALGANVDQVIPVGNKSRSDVLVTGIAGSMLRAEARRADGGSADVRMQLLYAHGDYERMAAGATLLERFAAADAPMILRVQGQPGDTEPRRLLLATKTATVYEDICYSGDTLLPRYPASDFSLAQNLPEGASFFGTPYNQFVVASNGFLVFGATPPVCTPTNCSDNWSAFETEPEVLIAPYWDSLTSDNSQTLTVCRRESPTSTTIQWKGRVLNYATAQIAMQTVLHANGDIELVYGPGHTANGTNATIRISHQSDYGPYLDSTTPGAWFGFATQ